jgi:uncharacterized membrane-anchored protein
MKPFHTPAVDARYWVAITLASIFGTNLGDFYSHASGLGIVWGLCLLAAVALVVFLAERTDRRSHEAYYWLVIIIIRTGATNIADYLAFRVHISPAFLTVGLALVMGAVAWRATKAAGAAASDVGRLPQTDAPYWVAMLAAGVFGTVLGDVCSHVLGQTTASIGLGLLLGVVWFVFQRRVATSPGSYWLTVSVARTAGTALGDWLAENPSVDIGLPLATVLTGAVFVSVLCLWPSRRTVPMTTTDTLGSLR